MLIQIRELQRVYQVGEELVRALNGVDLDIAQNEYVAKNESLELLFKNCNVECVHFLWHNGRCKWHASPKIASNYTIVHL